MDYFVIDDIDYSKYINSLKVNTKTVYNAQTNAAGDTVADYINSKRTIEVGIIPLDKEAMIALQTSIKEFDVDISFLNPKTGEIEQYVKCIIPDDAVEYYTIQGDKVMYKGFNLKFIEL
jgi:hypothetical protein